MTPRPLFLATLILLAALSRLLPHPPNFTPLAAMGLFAAASFSSRWVAFAVPLAAFFLSDLALGVLIHFGALGGWLAGGSGIYLGSPVNYAAMAAVVALGFVLRTRQRPGWIAGTSLAASTLFFALSNFAVWAGTDGTMYSRDLAGLAACYTAALPFFGNTVMGDLFFVAVLFGIAALARRRFPTLAPQPATVRATE